MEEQYLQGNQFVKANQFENALNCYESAVKKAATAGSLSLTVKNLQSAQGQLVDLLLRCILNRGFCHWKLRNYSLAVDDFTYIIEKYQLEYLLVVPELCSSLEQSDTPENPIMSFVAFNQNMESYFAKAILRRITCYEYMFEYHKALRDLQLLFSFQPSYATKQDMIQLYKRLQSTLSQDNIVAKQEGTLNWMHNTFQSLRLFFLRALPLHITVEEPFVCKIGLINELGLYNRNLCSSINGTSIGKLACKVIPLTASFSSTTTASSALCIPTIQLVGATKCAQNPHVVKEEAVKDNGLEWEIAEDGKVTMNLRFIYHAEQEQVNNVNDNEHNQSWHCLLHFYVSSFFHTEMMVIPIISLPIRVSLKQQSENVLAEVNQQEELQVSCIRPITISSHTTTIYAYESPGLLGIGGKIWDSNFILLAYLTGFRKQWIEGKTVIELGSGPGAAGLALAFLSPKRLLMTDMADVIPLTKKNVELNKQLQSDDTEVFRLLQENRVEAMEYVWGTALLQASAVEHESETINSNSQNNNQQIFLSWCEESDIIVASDVVYYPEAYQPLVTTIHDLLHCSRTNEGSDSLRTNQKRHMILAHRHRHPEDHKFFELLYNVADLQIEEIRWKEEMHQQQASFQDIRLFHILPLI